MIEQTDTIGSIPCTAEPSIDINLVTESAQFKNWLAQVDRKKFNIRSIHIQSVDMFGPKLGFIKFSADVVDDQGKFLPGIIFMRGGSVAILPVLTCKGKRHAVLTIQPRLATGQFNFTEIPAGMLDGSGDFKSVASKEMEEELGLHINASQLIDLCAQSEIQFPQGVYLSPGASDETIRLFAYEKEVTEEELSDLNGRCTGALEEGEQITLRIAALEDLVKVPDAKTLVALNLYLLLKAAG